MKNDLIATISLVSNSPAPFWEPLLNQLKVELTQAESAANLLQQAQQSIIICRGLLKELQDHVVNINFASQAEEIFFFKEVKPQFYGRLIYYHEMYNIEIGCPVGVSADDSSYFLAKLKKIRDFFESNKFYYTYLRSNDTFLDDRLFTRNQQSTFMLQGIYDLNTHPAFSTPCDYIFSRIIANELLTAYLNSKLKTGTIAAGGPLSQPAKKRLTWTEPKIFAIELAYALKAKGVFNNGNVTLKDITDHLQEWFHIQLPNPSRDFQEILRRKSGYSGFLDSLKESYLKYIDAIETKERH